MFHDCFGQKKEKKRFCSQVTSRHLKMAACFLRGINGNNSNKICFILKGGDLQRLKLQQSSRDDEVMIRSYCCVVFQTSAQQNACSWVLSRTGSYLPSKVITDGARFFSGCGDKAAVAAKASRGGEAPFRIKLQLFVLVLKTRRPASLAIRRGDGQHRILLFFLFFFQRGGMYS